MALKHQLSQEQFQELQEYTLCKCHFTYASIAK